jgi:hypothetical protein
MLAFVRTQGAEEAPRGGRSEPNRCKHCNPLIGGGGGGGGASCWIGGLRQRRVRRHAAQGKPLDQTCAARMWLNRSLTWSSRTTTARRQLRGRGRRTESSSSLRPCFRAMPVQCRHRGLEQSLADELVSVAFRS